MKTKTAGRRGNSKAVFKLLDFDLIGEGQWQHIQKRYRMTQREVEVAKLICRGFCSEEAAKSLDITYGTVKAHIRNIYRKAGVHNKIAMLLKFISEIAKAEPRARPSLSTKSSIRTTLKHNHICRI